MSSLNLLHDKIWSKILRKQLCINKSNQAVKLFSYRTCHFALILRQLSYRSNHNTLKTSAHCVFSICLYVNRCTNKSYIFCRLDVDEFIREKKKHFKFNINMLLVLIYRSSVQYPECFPTQIKFL